MPEAIPDLSIVPAAPDDLPFVLELLADGGLPVAEAGDHLARFLVARLAGERVGCIGREDYGEHVLLRSLAVRRDVRGLGIGATLLFRALEAAREAGAKTAWGLTTFGRKGLFARLGFRVVPKPDAPPALFRSAQFRGVCPESAVLIVLDL